MPVLRILLTIICVLTPFASVAQDLPAPAGAFRWDADDGRITGATPGPTPKVHAFNVPLHAPNCIDVDEIGRMYFSDAGRQVIARYDANGVLDGQWQEDVHDATFCSGRLGVQVLSGGRVYLGQHPGSSDIRRVGPLKTDNREFRVDPSTCWWVMAAEDGSFYSPAPILNLTDPDEPATRCRILAYDIEGRSKPGWEVDSFQCGVVANDSLMYLVPQSGKLRMEVWDLAGQRVRQIELERTLGRNHAASIECMDVDTNGDIYVQCLDGLLYRLSSDGSPLARWLPYRSPEHPKTGLRFGWFAVSRGLIYAQVVWSADASGSLAPATQIPGWEIQVFTSRGQCIARYLNKPGPIAMPTSIAVQVDGSYAVAMRGGSRAAAFDSGGTLLNDFKPSPSGLSMLVAQPGGYLATSYGKLLRYDENGLNGRTVYSSDSARGSLDNFWQAALDPTSGDIWGLGWSGIISRLTPDYKLANEFPQNGDLSFRTFSVGMAMDRQGYIYVPNAYGHCIVKIDKDGNIVRKIGKEGSGLGELKYPEGIVIDQQGRIYVADSGNCRIQAFAPDGTPLGFWGKPGKGNGEFDRPYGLALGPNNTLWIADTFNDRIVRVVLKDFWASLGKEGYFEQLVQAPAREPAPTPATTVVYGVVVAGSDDFKDVVYVEDPYRNWAVEVVLPKNTKLNRGVTARLSGRMEMKEREPVRLYADKVEIMTRPNEKYAIPMAHGMDAMYIGDGYRNGDKRMDKSNLGMLVRAWVKVVSVERENGLFIVNDGTFAGGGLVVRVDNTRADEFVWPQAGQDLAVCGISVSWKDPAGKPWSAIRVREQGDVVVLNP